MVAPDGGRRRKEEKFLSNFLKLYLNFKIHVYWNAVMWTKCDSVQPIINGMITKGSIWPISQNLGVYNSHWKDRRLVWFWPRSSACVFAFFQIKREKSLISSASLDPTPIILLKIVQREGSVLRLWTWSSLVSAFGRLKSCLYIPFYLTLYISTHFLMFL